MLAGKGTTSVFILNFEHITRLFLAFLSLTLSIHSRAWSKHKTIDSYNHVKLVTRKSFLKTFRTLSNSISDLEIQINPKLPLSLISSGIYCLQLLCVTIKADGVQFFGRKKTILPIYKIKKN